MELNQFADRNPSHFTKSMKPDLEDLFTIHSNATFENKNVTKMIANSQPVDWSLTDKLNPPTDQKTCNGDWALSAVEALESALAIKTNSTAEFNRISVQHLIDCDTRNQGCLGGWPVRAWKFFYDNGMVAPEDYFYKQYLGIKRSCLSVRGKPMRLLAKQFRGRSYLTLHVEQMMNFAAVQPMSVAINAPMCVRLYKSGILSQAECDCTSLSYEEVEVTEIMTLIGYGPTQETDKEYAYCSGYWLLRASWGA